MCTTPETLFDFELTLSLDCRLDQEKQKLSRVQEAEEQNLHLREQITALSRQIELQQELSQRQVGSVRTRQWSAGMETCPHVFPLQEVHARS